MRRIAVIALIGTLAGAAYGGKDSVISYEDEWVMYSRFEAQTAELAGDNAALGGIYAGGLLNGQFILGVGFNSLLGTAETESPFLKDLEFLDFWYGGLHTGYIFRPDRLVHLSLECLVGGGQLETETVAGFQDSQTLFAVQPTLGLRMNITETISIGLNAGYLYIDATGSEALEASDLTGPTAGIFLHFTEF